MLVKYGGVPILQLPSKVTVSVNVDAFHSRYVAHTALLPADGHLELRFADATSEPYLIMGGVYIFPLTLFPRSLPPIGAADSNPAWYDLTLSRLTECANPTMRMNGLSVKSLLYICSRS